MGRVAIVWTLAYLFSGICVGCLVFVVVYEDSLYFCCIFGGRACLMHVSIVILCYIGFIYRILHVP